MELAASQIPGNNDYVPPVCDYIVCFSIHCTVYMRRYTLSRKDRVAILAIMYYLL